MMMMKLMDGWIERTENIQRMIRINLHTTIFSPFLFFLFCLSFSISFYGLNFVGAALPFITCFCFLFTVSPSFSWLSASLVGVAL